MAGKDRVLIVDDEIKICHFISTVLSANGYETSTAQTGGEACSMIEAKAPDLVLLDLGLPDMDGTSVIEAVRARSELPIIVISARMDERDKVQALDLGADDYITKPFGSSEFLARVRTAIRHYRAKGGKSGIFTGELKIGDLTIDFDKHQVLVMGENAHLTQIEFRIVALLGQNAGKVLTYDHMLAKIWGAGLMEDNKLLRVNMANIRRKIEVNPTDPKYIFTEIGVGYRLRDVES